MEIGKKKNRQWHRSEYKKNKQNTKMMISLAKRKKQKECASDLNDPNKQSEIFRIAK